MSDRTKGNRMGPLAQNPNIDKSWGDVLFNGGAIQSVENQNAGPKATFKCYCPSGDASKDGKAGSVSKKNRN